MNALAALLRIKSFRWLALACGAIGGVLSFVPLFAVQGVESALVLGALVPPCAAALGARAALAARRDGMPTDGLALAMRGACGGALLLLAPALVLWLNALRVRNCAPLEGALFIALGPGFGAVLAGLAGAAVGAFALPPRLATLLAICVPLADSVRALYDFYATPGVFAYGQFFGYFPGPLYDDLIELPWPLFTLRAVTAAACGALACLLASHYDPVALRLQIWPLPRRGATSAFGLVLAFVVALGCSQAEQLGHRASAAHIADQLGGRAIGKRCELVLPRELRRERKRRMLADCDFRVRELERYLGVRQPGRVRVFVFRSADEKRRLMGAADTNIAKPWRCEVYLQDDTWPHPVLPHELAHVLLGNLGRGPLRVPGRAFGLWPDFALVEGAAVAAAWASSAGSGLTPHQWVRAMLEAGIAPKLETLFGAGFLAHETRLAYTISGSLLRFIAERYGVAAFRKIYAGGRIEPVLGVALPELERTYRAYLGTIELPASARALARQRFAGSSILTDVCPHEKAKLKRVLDGYLAADDELPAIATCRSLLAIDPAEAGVRATLAGALARSGRQAAAERELQGLAADKATPAPTIAAARLLLADEAFRHGQYERAHATYRELMAAPNERDALRVLQVKALALEGSARQRDLLFALLVGDPGEAVDGATAVYLARELRSERSDGLPEYLEARQLYNRERYADAAGLLTRARGLGLPSAELATEERRLEAISRFAIGELAASRELWLAQKSAQPGPALEAEADDWLLRIADAQASRAP